MKDVTLNEIASYRGRRKILIGDSDPGRYIVRILGPRNKIHGSVTLTRKELTWLAMSILSELDQEGATGK